MSENIRNQKKGNQNAWNTNKIQTKKQSSTQHNLKPTSTAEHKFKEAQLKLQAAVQKYAKEYESSSEDEDYQSNNVIDSVIKKYSESGGRANSLGRTQTFLEDSFQSGACLICISTIKKSESIWNCASCYCYFHLTCIQRWSKDSVFQQKQNLEGRIQAYVSLKLFWGCPKCRFEYNPSYIPLEYRCFCGKVVDPPFQPLLVPHSCGEICGKPLKPSCGHFCILLCHPGPCPPCPTTVKVTCYCGLQPPRLQRCSSKEWSCGSPCSKLLACGKHKCEQPCHHDDCPPCPKKSIQKCLCKSSHKLRDCLSPIWQCDKVCNKPIDCGHHNCLKVCHSGDCGSCELSKPRACPCGKSTHELPCTEDTPTCGDTCGKLLECSLHICNQRCHKDKCGTCLDYIVQTCRCGLHTKEVQCSKPYLCETKCKQFRDCYKHPCNRKCCDGNCPPCEKLCNRTLTCSNHKCSSVCHRGPCYPCNLTETVSCRCSGTIITVACGRKNKTKPPKCNIHCSISPDCHHERREPHRCHFGDCPSCRQICNKSFANCPHKCLASCHSAVFVKTEGQKATMPWEDTGPKIELKNLPCPDCIVPVPVTCLGKHETCDYPCYLAKSASCQRPCGRMLKCENHNCSLLCHTVEGSFDDLKAGTNCENCERECSKSRPEGCQHTCLKPCHPGPCPPCKQMLRIRCHCGLNQPYVVCSEWMLGNKEELQSCANQCPKNYNCGHRCRSNCHSGSCVNSEGCKKKVKVFCNCKRIKKEFSCAVVVLGGVAIECDEICGKKKEEEKRIQDLQNEQKKRDEELKNLKELKEFERKFQGKKKLKERHVTKEVSDGNFTKYWILSAVLVLLLAVYFLFVNSR